MGFVQKHREASLAFGRTTVTYWQNPLISTSIVQTLQYFVVARQKSHRWKSAVIVMVVRMSTSIQKILKTEAMLPVPIDFEVAFHSSLQTLLLETANQFMLELDQKCHLKQEMTTKVIIRKRRQTQKMEVPTIRIDHQFALRAD